MAVAVSKQAHAVVVVAESALLAGAGTAGGAVELDRIAPHRLPPLGDDVPAVALGHGHRIKHVGGDGREAEAAGGAGRCGQSRGAHDEGAEAEGGTAT